MSKRKFKIVETWQTGTSPAFYTERNWAADYLARFECGDQEFPRVNCAQGASVCIDPVCIVLVDHEN